MNPGWMWTACCNLAAESPGKTVKIHPEGKVSLTLSPEESPFAQLRHMLQYIGGNDN